MVCVGKGLKDHLVPPPCHGHRHLPLDPVAPSLIQFGLGHFQEWAATIFFGKLFMKSVPEE